MKDKIFLILGLLSLWLQTNVAKADNYCWVTSESNSSSDIEVGDDEQLFGSLRSIITKINTGEGNCQIASTEPSEFKYGISIVTSKYFEEFNLVYPDDSESEYVDTINLESNPLSYSNSSKPLIIGNATPDLVSDSGEINYSPAFIDSIAQDWGQVTIDATDLPEGSDPFECASGAKVYLRNIKIKVKSGVDPFANGCAIDAGANEVCSGVHCGISAIALNTNFDFTGPIIIEEDFDDDEDGFDDVADGGTDCNDNNASIHPGAAEACDGVDNDCDGSIDEGVTLDAYPDVDTDGYGDAEEGITVGCTIPSGFVTNGNDCDDSNASVKPSASESTEAQCSDGVDNNCNGLIDTDSGCPDNTGIDNDGDGYTEEEGDCNDDDPDSNPGMVEACGNFKDDDCNGLIDEQECNNPAVDDDGDGVTEDGGDCDDTNAEVNPQATDICGDGIDNNCDGIIGDTPTINCSEDIRPPTGGGGGGCSLTLGKSPTNNLSLFILLMLLPLGISLKRFVKF